MSKCFWYFKKKQKVNTNSFAKIWLNFITKNVNFCECYYSPKLLASSPLNLQIMSVLLLCKLISLNIWVTKFKTSIVQRFCAYSDANIMKRTLLSLA